MSSSGFIKQPVLGTGIAINTLIVTMQMQGTGVAAKGGTYVTNMTAPTTAGEGQVNFWGSKMRANVVAKDTRAGIFGLALEDISAGGTGRFMLRGEFGLNDGLDAPEPSGALIKIQGTATAITDGENFYATITAEGANMLKSEDDSTRTDGNQKIIARPMKDITGQSNAAAFKAPMFFNGIEGFGTASP